MASHEQGRTRPQGRHGRQTGRRVNEGRDESPVSGGTGRRWEDAGIRGPQTIHLAGSGLLGGDGVTRPTAVWGSLVRESERGSS